jgi:hypothetical protein
MAKKWKYDIAYRTTERMREKGLNLVADSIEKGGGRVHAAYVSDKTFKEMPHGIFRSVADLEARAKKENRRMYEY